VKVGVPKESAEGERRVALVPDVIRRLGGKGLEVAVESGAGAGASIEDAAFQEAGATTDGPDVAWATEVVAKVAPPSGEEIDRLERGAVLIGFLAPLTSPETTRALAEAHVTAFAMEAIPRITRAQSADALSSQATVAGYRAALIAAQELGRFFPMLTTAAGTVAPAKVLVLGAGVAGLQAIATARRIGAVVSGFDVRTAVREQVESLGASFLDLGLETDAEGEGGYARELSEEDRRRQQEALAERTADFDAVITTALVPGRPAPILITAETVANMRAGSVIVDLAGEAGGNCELSEPGEKVVRDGVTIVAPLSLPSSMAEHASQLYARNVASLLELMVEDGELSLNLEDEVLKGACITHEGAIVHEGARQAAESS
jgi:NAD(P) transhydrogenase subunit alpha